MEHIKGRGRGLDKPTRSALTGLDWALAESAEKTSPIQPDEWTTRQVFDALRGQPGAPSIDSLQKQHKRLVDMGKATSRKVLRDGHYESVFRRA